MTRFSFLVRASQSLILAIACVSLLPGAASAQTFTAPEGMTPQQISLGCALPPVISTVRADALHIVGAQDTIPRSLFNEHDLLIVDGGTGRGVELGQKYFVRRPVSSSVYTGDAKAIVTAGWIGIVAVNQTTAIASVDHVCSQMESGDYLEAFTTPVVPAAAMKVDRSGDPDFGTLGRVLFGEDERIAAGIGEYMMIDRGADQGVAPGARFAIYRDVKDWLKTGDAREPLPLSVVGEGVVVTAGPKMSVIRILEARDAVERGDYVVPRPASR